MDPGVGWVIPLAEAAGVDEGLIGGKAAKLAELARAGFPVPGGFVVTAGAYEHFVSRAGLASLIRMELGRKPFASMRWEEIWDVALRIRSAFLAGSIPPALAEAVAAAVESVGASKPLAVRSSAPGEDSAGRSFAGLHESVVGVVGAEDVLEALRVVWASLWSDAALLYRQELELDPGRSRMAVVVQEVVVEDRSGVAFGLDPRQMDRDRAIVEAVPGPGSDLVDGLVDPDRWILDRDTGEVVEWRAGQREGDEGEGPLLEGADLRNLHGMLLAVEGHFGWPPDTEWTGRGKRFTLLQARPITTAAPEEGDPRGWYLSLRPGMKRLKALAERVAGEMIPELEQVGRRFARESVEDLDDGALAGAIEARRAALDKWRQIYLEDFIPFAHGVRQLGIYYNDAVQPDDPYEFVGLLRGQRMLAQRRNRVLGTLAERLRADPALYGALAAAGEGWEQASHSAQAVPGGESFVRELEQARDEFMDVAYAGERLADRPDLLLATVLEMARSPGAARPEKPEEDDAASGVGALEQRLLAAVGAERQEEARQVLEIGRLSWRLRDDDNVLVGRLESQLLRALEEAARRLRAAGRLRDEGRVSIEAAPELAEGLRDSYGGRVRLPEPPAEAPAGGMPAGESPRQLVGQPAAPGLATGRVRPVRDSGDLGRFRAGEVLVCDAIQPTMTHLVPLAAAVVERRGGMLIHGAIIARELGIPCVNGIPDAVNLLEEGAVVTVDGYLGIVTVGAPVFDVEEG